jgi:two-component system alkaline phosphatase synthesis response regulator PhoP
MSNKPRVLIVEDDLAMVGMLSNMLEEEGYETRSGIGEKALRLAEEYQPDVILLDVMMPVMDGLEWSNRAKATPSLNKVPIIALSAANFSTLKRTFKDLQADSFLSKPFEMDTLINLFYIFSQQSQNIRLAGAGSENNP